MTGAPIQDGVELSIAATPEEVRRASDWLEASARALGVPEDDVGRLVSCLNEALANIISHGGAGAREAPVRLGLRVSREPAGHAADLALTDAGDAFNPLEHAPKARPQTLAEAEVGGLGIMMMRQFSDRMSYRRADGRNHLSIGVRWGV